MDDRLDHLFAGFEDQASRTPEAEALRHRGQAITCRRLLARSRAIARGLRARGVEAGDLVGLHCERSIDGVAAMLGILGAGAAVLPLPPALPALRIEELIAHARPGAVLMAGDGARAPRGVESDPGLGSGWPLAAVEAEGIDSGAELPSPAPSAPAFVLASSGSTGTPKLIVRSHRSFFHRLRWTWSAHPFESGEVCCQKSPLTTTHAVYELFEPLLRGVPTVIVPDDTVRALPEFWALLEAEGVTRALLVPSMVRASLRLEGFSPTRLRVLVLMGEAVTRPLADRIARAFPPPTALYSIYGSTEASSTLLVDLHRDRPGRELPLGRPLSEEVSIRVLDEEGKGVPPGGEGRLWIAGTPLFDGYLGDPEATARVIRTAPDGTRLFDSRDTVAIDDDGHILYRGRADQAVKIRGFRVDLGEVERVLGAAPGVSNLAVVAADLSSGEGSPSLIGFVAPATVPTDRVRAHLAARLPDYMVPSLLVPLERLPTLPNGKVDRVALAEGVTRAPDRPEVDESAGTLPRLRALWEEVLGHGLFEDDQGFFAVGGDSLNVFALARRVRAAFGLSPEGFPERTVFAHPTLAGLAVEIDRLRSGEAPTPTLGSAHLLTLREGDAARAPLFLISPAGGSPAPYQRFVDALETDRPVIGVRDPFLLGERRIDQSFEDWAATYREAIAARAESGPIHLMAYSSAVAFALEIAEGLRRDGRVVPTLVLVDPLSLGWTGNGAFERRAFTATWGRASTRALLRLLGALRAPFVRPGPSAAGGAGARASRASEPDDAAPDPRRPSLPDRQGFSRLTALMELNTGSPLWLPPDRIPGPDPEESLRAVAEHLRGLLPDFEPEALERLAIQYQAQVRAQHRYRLRFTPGTVVLVEPDSPYRGLLRAVLRPYVESLEYRAIPLAPPDERLGELLSVFGPHAPHFRCMRDDGFCAALAAEVAPHLAIPDAT